MSVERINNAIRSCLDRCYESDHATGSVAVFVQELRDSGEWTNEELQAVYSTVMRLLRALDIDRREAAAV